MRYKFIIACITAAMTCIIIEGMVRHIQKQSNQVVFNTVEQLISELPNSKISGREIGNQMLVHNIALFSNHPNPNSIEIAYVGTSRTKIIRPSWLGQYNAVNASGNSYNEISYGLLLQAETTRLMFPNLKQMYIEASLLLRRPNRFIIEEDHIKYSSLLESILPLRDKLLEAQAFRSTMQEFYTENTYIKNEIHVLKTRNNIRFSSLLANFKQAAIPVKEDNFFKQVNSSGERLYAPNRVSIRSKWIPPIGKENVKVQRLRDIRSWMPWDQLYDLIALWGKVHNLEIIFFQPPVREDLYKFQLENGLIEHVADMKRISKKYDFKFIDLNTPERGYIKNWYLFSDEDHLETCDGIFTIMNTLMQESQTSPSTPIFIRNMNDSQKKAYEKLISVCN